MGTFRCRLFCSSHEIDLLKPETLIPTKSLSKCRRQPSYYAHLSLMEQQCLSLGSLATSLEASLATGVPLLKQLQLLVPAREDVGRVILLISSLEDKTTC